MVFFFFNDLKTALFYTFLAHMPGSKRNINIYFTVDQPPATTHGLIGSIKSLRRTRRIVFKLH